VLEEHLRYWRKQLGGNPRMLELPTDHPRPRVPSFRGAAKTFSLPGALSQSLKALSRWEGVTMFMLLLAAFKTLLYRYTSQKDIIVGTAVANRNRAEVEQLIGFFVNMLPMRTDLSGNPRFTQLLKRVKEAALGAYAYQELPFDKLVEELQPGREPGKTPLFNIAFGVHNAPREEAQLAGLKVTSATVGQEAVRFDLTLWIAEGAEAMRAGWTYSTDLFEEETIIKMQGHFETLLSSIVARPDAPLDELEMFSETEKSQRSTGRIVREERHYKQFKNVKPTAVALSKDNRSV
jgi:non-ribosomal peptide synthetase component F